MSKVKTIELHTDPGHGWGKVQRSELVELGIEQKISPYSYEYNGTVYLEEDGDLGTYINALKDKGYTVEFDEKYTDRNSFVRSLNTYIKR